MNVMEGEGPKPEEFDVSEQNKSESITHFGRMTREDHQSPAVETSENSSQTEVNQFGRQTIEKPENKQQSRISRRAFLGGVAATAAVTGTTYLANRFFGSSHHDSDPSLVQNAVAAQMTAVSAANESSIHKKQPDQDAIVLNATSNQETVSSAGFKSENPLVFEANRLFDTPIFLPEGSYNPYREIAEKEFVNTHCKTIEDIDFALSVCFTRNARVYIMSKRAEMRGDSGLTKDEIKYAKEYGVDQEILEMCKEVYYEMLPILEHYITDPDLGFTDGDKKDLARTLVSPGGMARLIASETTDFTFLGGGLAINQYGGDYAQGDNLDGAINLRKYLAVLRDTTGINYTEENIPGSVKTPADMSGGAIGIQFMPNEALKISKYMQGLGETGNIFDPIQSIKMAYLYMITKNYEDFYSLEDKVERFRRWNPKRSEDQVIAEADQVYMDRFPRKRPAA